MKHVVNVKNRYYWTNLARYTDLRFFSLGLVNDVNAIDEDIFQAPPKILCCRQVRQILLYYSSYIHLRGIEQESAVLIKPECSLMLTNIYYC